MKTGVIEQQYGTQIPVLGELAARLCKRTGFLEGERTLVRPASPLEDVSSGLKRCVGTALRSAEASPMPGTG